MKYANPSQANKVQIWSMLSFHTNRRDHSAVACMTFVLSKCKPYVLCTHGESCTWCRFHLNTTGGKMQIVASLSCKYTLFRSEPKSLSPFAAFVAPWQSPGPVHPPRVGNVGTTHSQRRSSIVSWYMRLYLLIHNIIYFESARYKTVPQWLLVYLHVSFWKVCGVHVFPGGSTICYNTQQIVTTHGSWGIPAVTLLLHQPFCPPWPRWALWYSSSPIQIHIRSTPCNRSKRARLFSCGAYRKAV